MNAEIKFKTNERKIDCCSCGARTADYYFTAEPMGCGGIENWCFRCEDDLRENETDKLVRNIEQVYICQGCNCDIEDNGFCSEGCTHGQDDDEEEGSTTNEDDEEDKICECCGEFHDVGLATGENGIEMWVCEVCDIDGSNYNGWGDETEYMNELMECFKCECDVKRKNMAWGMGGCYYLDVCKKCYE